MTREINDVLFPTAPTPQTSSQSVGQSPRVLVGYACIIVVHDLSYLEAFVDGLCGSVETVLGFPVGGTDTHPTVLVFRWYSHMGPPIVCVS